MCYMEATDWSDAAVVVCNSMALCSPMQSYVIYGLQSGRQQHMLLIACLATSIIVKHALSSTLVVKIYGRSKVYGLYTNLSQHRCRELTSGIACMTGASSKTH